MGASTQKMISAIHQIADYRRELEELDRKRSRVLANLIGLLENVSSAERLSEAGHGIAESVLQRKVERISNAWLTILQGLLAFRHFNAGDVERIANGLLKDGKLVKPQSRENIRAQLTLFTKRRMIRRMGGGNYLFLPETKQLLQIRTPRIRKAVPQRGRNSPARE